MRELVVGSRGSKLALTQTGLVVDQLKKLNPEISYRINIIKTTGDKITDVPLAKIGDKGLFVKEIETALLEGKIDFAVHSAKDLPSEMDDLLCIAAYPERENPADALVSKCGTLEELSPGAVVGTSSLRRRLQVLHARPDLSIADLRGNLDTRLRKLDDGVYDAVILAYAGLARMGWESRITQALPYDSCLPAAGQGALGIQCRKDSDVCGILSALDHKQTRACVTAERSLLEQLGAGCQTPVAVLGKLDSDIITLDAVIISIDGTNFVRMQEFGSFTEPEQIGKKLAKRLLDSPARDILNNARLITEPKGMGAA